MLMYLLELNARKIKINNLNCVPKELNWELWRQWIWFKEYISNRDGESLTFTSGISASEQMPVLYVDLHEHEWDAQVARGYLYWLL